MYTGGLSIFHQHISSNCHNTCRVLILPLKLGHLVDIEGHGVVGDHHLAETEALDMRDFLKDSVDALLSVLAPEGRPRAELAVIGAAPDHLDGRAGVAPTSD